MKNLSSLDNTDEAINLRWEMLHPNNKVVAVGKANNGTDTILSEPLNKPLAQSLAIHSMFMVIINELDFSKAK